MKIQITQGGNFKCLIEILEDGSVKVLGAINGWGDSCIEDVTAEIQSGDKPIQFPTEEEFTSEYGTRDQSEIIDVYEKLLSKGAWSAYDYLFHKIKKG